MKKQHVLIRLLKKVFKRYGLAIVIVLLCIVGQAVCTVQGQLFQQRLIDDYIMPLIGQPSPDFSGLLSALTVMACFFLAGIIFAYDRTTHGDIMSVYTNDIDTLRQLISQSIPQFTSSAITIVTVLVSMLTLNVTLTAVSVVMVCVILFISRSIGSRSAKYFIKQQETLGKVNGYIEEMISGQKVVKVFNHEEKAIEGFRNINEELRESSYQANKFANVLMPVTIQTGNMSYILCAVIGAVLALSGFDSSLTIGTLVAFMTLNKSFNNPIGQVSMQINSIAMAQAGAKRIFELLDQEKEVDEGIVTLCRVEIVDGKMVETDKRTGHRAWRHPRPNGEIELVEMKGDLKLENVNFGYFDDHMVLHDISVFANPGEKIAFVGATGAGKTTITNLINRFYDIADGKIRYDGININKIKKPDLRRSLGMVLQVWFYRIHIYLQEQLWIISVMDVWMQQMKNVLMQQN